MKSCEQCGSNEWWFKSQGGMTVATCKNCKNQLRWAKRKKKKISTSEPDACTCGCRKFEREKRQVTVEVLNLPYYFTYYFVCTKCKKEYPDKTTKKNNALYKG
jgi:hypothetical protein